ncbi:Cysteine-rich receptor-like protein kinase [Quillaja saponaria]|uniref:Cysteine-rich receptor-like protein kinase n=1 Tax=Quillaja saponaria TaxID=32244 RepID=A0AAD7LUN5_QUISA|nr:Cysteine-rich receptor-like protein kinase [Quillaja saponaria]KAJ7964382.1 Cysteine-rich receptor-like protein kinase [Quillaja saponaria]
MKKIKVVFLALSLTWWCWVLGVVADPQTTLLNSGCSQYNATSDFFDNLNATYLDIKAQLRNNNKHFVTATQSKGSGVHTMYQCRNYMSTADCVACFTAASSQIRNCSAANGARVIYDGCFLRYESTAFFDQTTLPGNSVICGNKTAPQPTVFNASIEQLLTDLLVATPRIKGYFAAIKREVVVSVNLSVYAIAQCAETVSESGCLDCLKVGYTNLQTCPPNTDGLSYDAGCFIRYSATPFFADNQTINITPFLKKGGSSKKSGIIGGVVGGVGLILVLVALFVWCRLSRGPKRAPRGDILGATELRGPVAYSYKDLKSATKNFSEETKLGEGGFGDVYKGTLKNGKVVAVKKLALGQSSRVEATFESEVKLISNVHHRNLIRLLGCCSKGPERILVYEYMANSSLDRFLFGERRGSLNWKQRYDIILGTARGLAYLHEEFHICIIHRDIKTSNILLDDYLQPKIADFGLARLLPEDQTHLSTKFAGTLGYTAPEYAIHGQLSEKADTYSYGVVLLEIISGQKSSELKIDNDSEYLLQRAWKLYESNSQLELVEDTIDPNDYDAEEMKKIIEIAIMCIQSSVAMRPTMSEVVVLLKSKGSIELTPPTRPVLVDSNQRIRGDTSTSTASSTSNATVSISHFSAR